LRIFGSYAALPKGHGIIPILRGGALLPWPLQSFEYLDFHYAPYQSAFLRLLAALRQPRERLGELFGVPALPEHYEPPPELLKQLEDLTTGKERVMALAGIEGTGKSWLASAYAHADGTRKAFPDGINWVKA
jgi:hypothetical protein